MCYSAALETITIAASHENCVQKDSWKCLFFLITMTYHSASSFLCQPSHRNINEHLSMPWIEHLFLISRWCLEIYSWANQVLVLIRFSRKSIHLVLSKYKQNISFMLLECPETIKWSSRGGVYSVNQSAWHLVTTSLVHPENNWEMYNLHAA